MKRSDRPCTSLVWDQLHFARQLAWQWRGMPAQSMLLCRQYQSNSTHLQVFLVTAIYDGMRIAHADACHQPVSAHWLIWDTHQCLDNSAILSISGPHIGDSTKRCEPFVVLASMSRHEVQIMLPSNRFAGTIRATHVPKCIRGQVRQLATHVRLI